MAFQLYLSGHIYIMFFAENVFETFFNNVAILFNHIKNTLKTIFSL
jgi:hypothetical protein